LILHFFHNYFNLVDVKILSLWDKSGDVGHMFKNYTIILLKFYFKTGK